MTEEMVRRMNEQVHPSGLEHILVKSAIHFAHSYGIAVTENERAMTDKYVSEFADGLPSYHKREMTALYELLKHDVITDDELAVLVRRGRQYETTKDGDGVRR